MRIGLRVAGLAVALAAALTTGVSEVPELGLSIRNVTASFASSAASETGVFFWVPDTRAILSMPIAGSIQGCAPSLSRWLKVHGTRALSPQDYLLTNKSSKSVRLRLRFDGTSNQAKSKPGFFIQCGVVEDRTGDATVSGSRPWAQAEFDLDAGKATEFSFEGNGGDKEFKDTVQPGQQVGLTIFLQGNGEASGQLLLSSTAETDGSIPLPVLQSTSATSELSWPGVPSLVAVRALVLKNAAGKSSLLCDYPPASASYAGFDCSRQELRNLIRGYRPALSAWFLPIRLG